MMLEDSLGYIASSQDLKSGLCSNQNSKKKKRKKEKEKEREKGKERERIEKKSAKSCTRYLDIIQYILLFAK